MRPDEEEATLLFLAQFQTAPVNQWIIDKAGELYRRWNPRKGTDINDSIQAAAVMHAGGKILAPHKNLWADDGAKNLKA